MAGNPAATGWLWSWYREHEDRLRQGHPLLFERILAGIVPVCCLEDPDGAVAHLRKQAEAPGAPRDAIALSIEKLRVNHRMRVAADGRQE